MNARVEIFLSVIPSFLVSVFIDPYFIFKFINFKYIRVKLSYYILYFAWEDQSDFGYCIFHTVLISCITVLYESRTVMCLIGLIQHTWANTVQLCQE